ncbi:MAG: NAD-dependent epimerase/dehydratase family protein [Spirochaetota bacterium]
MRILLTGGTGKVGPAVIEHLGDSGNDVLTVGRREHMDVPCGEYRRCDISDYDALLEAMRGCDAVVHLAAIASPVGRPGREVFRVNDLGTFNVFEAAAECGIARVVGASSINAFGYFYGDRSVELEYLPVDEAHPTLATDAYSFSKQVMEAIGRYFWDRDGISSVMLRLPGVRRHHQVLDEDGSMRARLNPDFIRALLALPDDERRAEIERLQSVYDRYRRQMRADRISRGEWMRVKPGLTDYITQDEILFMLQNVNFFTYLDDLDCAQAIEKGLTVEYEGSHELFINAKRNTLGLPLEEMAKLYPGEPEVREQRPGDDTLVSIDRARDLLGFEARWATPPLLG